MRSNEAQDELQSEVRVQRLAFWFYVKYNSVIFTPGHSVHWTSKNNTASVWCPASRQPSTVNMWQLQILSVRGAFVASRS